MHRGWGCISHVCRKAGLELGYCISKLAYSSGKLMGLLLTSCVVQETCIFHHCIICFCSQSKYIELCGAVWPHRPGRRETARIQSKTLWGQCRMLIASLS